MTAIYLVSAIYIAVFFMTCAMWMTKRITLMALVVIVIILGLLAATFAVQQRDSAEIKKQQRISCQDRVKIANALDDFHLTILHLTQATARRLRVVVAHEKPGRVKSQNAKTLATYEKIIDSIHIVYVKDCKLHTGR